MISSRPGLARIGALTLAVMTMAPGVSWSQIRFTAEPAGRNVGEASVFKCQDDKALKIQFSSGGSEFYAVVDAGDGPHRLNVKPWKVGDEPEIVWSDGSRTLVWSAGVKLMFMDGATHLACGRAEHNH